MSANTDLNKMMGLLKNETLMIGEGECRETYASFYTGLDIRPAHIFWEKKRKEIKPPDTLKGLQCIRVQPLCPTIQPSDES